MYWAGGGGRPWISGGGARWCTRAGRTGTNLSSTCSNLTGTGSYLAGTWSQNDLRVLYDQTISHTSGLDQDGFCAAGHDGVKEPPGEM